MYAIKEEREDEAKNPGPEQVKHTICMETSNITSGNTNWPTVLTRKACVQFVQELCLTAEQRAAKEAEATTPQINLKDGPQTPSKQRLLQVWVYLRWTGSLFIPYLTQ